jgi:hypothetical protein
MSQNTIFYFILSDFFNIPTNITKWIPCFNYKYIIFHELFFCYTSNIKEREEDPTIANHISHKIPTVNNRNLLRVTVHTRLPSIRL